MEITGLPGVSPATLAGAHGELAGMLMVRAYDQARNYASRCKAGIPDSAHGTNPASAVMAGFEAVDLASDQDGNVDLEALREVPGPDLAGVMITLPSTLGLSDTNIVEVCRVVHAAGGLVYGDGANTNALLGRAGRSGLRRGPPESAQDLQHPPRRRRPRRRPGVRRQLAPALSSGAGSEADPHS